MNKRVFGKLAQKREVWDLDVEAQRSGLHGEALKVPQAHSGHGQKTFDAGAKREEVCQVFVAHGGCARQTAS